MLQVENSRFRTNQIFLYGEGNFFVEFWNLLSTTSTTLRTVAYFSLHRKAYISCIADNLCNPTIVSCGCFYWVFRVVRDLSLNTGRGVTKWENHESETYCTPSSRQG